MSLLFPDKMFPQIGEYAELGNVTREMVDTQEVEFANEIKSRAEANGGKLKYQTCTKAQEELGAEEILSQKKVVDGLKSKYPGQFQTLELDNCLHFRPHINLSLCRSEVPPHSRL